MNDVSVERFVRLVFRVSQSSPVQGSVEGKGESSGRLSTARGIRHKDQSCVAVCGWTLFVSAIYSPMWCEKR